ncbi:MAG: hypothetical protein H5T85_04655 [Actinobacteria bacterium]|nr:hypothetical protein [Actinomycetota bacterium]
MKNLNKNKDNSINNIRSIIYKLLEINNGILRLKPTWVARENCSSGKRLGLQEDEYNKGERGEITERWIASATKAENRIGPKDEGLSYIYIEDGPSITLKEAMVYAKDLILGNEYSLRHNDLGILVKVLDYSDRIFFHYHQMEKDANLVKKNPKEEAYYFPCGISLGAHPETFFGFHPYIAQQKKLILSYLIDWNSDLILKHSRAYLQTVDDGFHVPPGIPHAPGTALTIEIQQPSDVYGNLQALYKGKIMSKDTLFRDIRDMDRRTFGEEIVISQIDWERSCDPYFYENRHIPPILIEKSRQQGGEEYWVFYNSKNFSGKRLIVYPGESYYSKESGAYVVFVWRGEGTFDGHFVKAGTYNYDELIISYERAIKLHEIKNKSSENLEIFKFFGPVVNKDAPVLHLYNNSNVSK